MISCQYSEQIPGSNDGIDCTELPQWLLGGWFPQTVNCEAHARTMLADIDDTISVQACHVTEEWVYWLFHQPMLMRAPIRDSFVWLEDMESVPAYSHAHAFAALSELEFEN